MDKKEVDNRLAVCRATPRLWLVNSQLLPRLSIRLGGRAGHVPRHSHRSCCAERGDEGGERTMTIAEIERVERRAT